MTERLLIDAGISSGMRVLDVGCGRGDVSLIAAKLVGATGRVVGLDRDAGAISSAQARARDAGIAQAEFIVGDVLIASAHGAAFDAVIARRVLMYQPDRPAVLRALVAALGPAGLVVFQEADATMVPAPLGANPLHEQVTRWIWQTVAREGATTSIGFELPGLLELAGVEVRGVRAEAVVQTPSHRHVTAWIVRAMLPRILEHGVASEADIDIETLDARLEQELHRTKQAFIGDMVFSIWGRKKPG
jgi:SAM-dependent methyltransferase